MKYSIKRIPFGNKKKRSTDIRYHIDKTQKHYANKRSQIQMSHTIFIHMIKFKC